VDLCERDGFLYAGLVRIADLVERLGTPLVIFDSEAIIERFYQFVEAFSSLRAMICFATESCPNAHILHRLVKRGAALRVRSAINLERAWLCGAPMGRVVYSGLGKTDMDIRAALDGLYSPLFQAGRLVEGKPPYYRGPVGYFSVETGAELERLARLAGGVRIKCRVLVHVSLDCSQERAFGAGPDETIQLFESYASDPRLHIAGLRVHLGNAGFLLENMSTAAARVSSLAERLTDRGFPIEAIDMGGGFACDWFDPSAPSPGDYARTLEEHLLPWVERGVKIIAEPGWSIIAAGSALVSRVLATRELDGQPIAAVDAVPSEPGQDTDRKARLVRTRDRHAHTGTIIFDADIERPGVHTSLECQLDDFILWPGGGAYARRDCPHACEVLLENGKVLVIRPRPAASEVLGPELESHEVLL